MNHLDLFSGIGGFALAASWAWPETHKVAAFVEKEAFCQQVLRQHWPYAPIYADIRTFDARARRGTTDLLTGGFPCQPFSLAGQRRGTADDRYLWPEMLRVIREARPRWVIGENVPNLVTLALDSVLSDLESEGYTAETLLIPACAVNAPHRRQRAWIIAHTQERGRQKLATQTLGKSPRPENRPQSGRGIITDSISPRRTQQRESVTGHAAQSGLEWRDWREIEPLICGSHDGLPHRMDRIKGLGNAIVPQVAYEIMRGIALAEN